MARFKTDVLALLVLVTALAPLDARAQSAEEDAAIGLFEKGKQAFKAGKFEEALPLFRSAHTVIDNVHTQYYLGRAYAATKHCEEALPFLAQVANKLPPQVETLRANDETRCLMVVARAKVTADDCRAALPMLESLEGRVTVEEEAWRAQKTGYCSTRATDFPANTPTRKAAYGLYEAGLTAESAGDLAGAAALFEKTLALADEPIVRRHLARAQVATAGCLPALATLDGIPKDGRTVADGDLRNACGSYAPRGDLAGKDLVKVVETVTKGLEARRAGKPAEALHHFDLASKAGQAPAIEAVAIDLLYELERCKQYAVRLAEATPAARMAVTKRTERLEACGVDAGVPGLGGGMMGAGTSLSISGGRVSFSTSQILEWTLVGTGATLLGISGMLAMQAQTDYDAAADETGFANDPNTSPSEAAQGYDGAGELQTLGDENTLTAQILAGVGIGALATGLTLMFLDGDDKKSSAQGQGGLELAPWVSTRGVGFAGRF
jgi:tetratricopeptide (TPR) repeat protein